MTDLDLAPSSALPVADATPTSSAVDRLEAIAEADRSPADPLGDLPKVFDLKAFDDAYAIGYAAAIDDVRLLLKYAGSVTAESLAVLLPSMWIPRRR